MTELQISARARAFRDISLPIIALIAVGLFVLQPQPRDVLRELNVNRSKIEAIDHQVKTLSKILGVPVEQNDDSETTE